MANGQIEVVILNVTSNSNDSWTLEQYTPYAASYLDGQSGSDTISGALNLNGGMGKDWIFGGPAADSLSGGAGNDVLTGGAASDVFVFGVGFGHDIITDFTHQGQESDKIDLDIVDASHSVAARIGAGQLTIAQDANVSTTVNISSSLWAAGDVLSVQNTTVALVQSWII